MNFINFHELTLENLGQWPKSIKIGTILGMSILIIVLGYWLIIKFNFEHYAIQRIKEMDLKAEFESKQHQASTLQAYSIQLQVMHEELGAMLKQLPAKNEMPGLLDAISKRGVASGLKFELFAPQPEVQHDFYIELPIKITVEGNYRQLAVFMSRIAEMNRIVTLHEFNIEKIVPRNKKTVLDDQLVMNLTVKIYRYSAS